MKLLADFKRQFEAALESEANDESLLSIVRTCQSSGGAQREIYDTLKSIWLEYGFDDHDGSICPIKDELEFAMEKVRYGGDIWDHGLSIND